MWITNVDSRVLFSAKGIKDAFARLDSLNFTTVYPVVWNGGVTLYPSEVLRATSGESMDTRAEFYGRDVVREALEAGAAHDLKVVPWFEYGFKAPASGAIARTRPGWLTSNLQGVTWKDVGGGVRMSWLNPLHPEVQNFYAALLNEFVTKYGVSHVQFDDNFSIPKDLLYDEHTRRMWLAEGGSGTPPASVADPRWADWQRWRNAKVTQAVRAIFGSVKAAHPRLHVQLSPNPYPWSMENYLQDWRAWLAQGSVDSIVVQLYRTNMQDFENELANTHLQAEKGRSAIGIGSGLRVAGKQVSAALVRQQGEAARRAGYPGVAIFFYDSLFDFAVPGETSEGRLNEIKTLFKDLSKEPNRF